MAVTAEKSRPSRLLNVPNQLTAARLVLAVVMFVLIPTRMYLSALAVFTVAASTDWVDGYWARRYGQVTKFGRIFDPFVDKIIICGAFIFLGANPASGIAAWMAVVVVGREMLVTALRSYIERAGGDFSAALSGKLKMVFQCLAVGMSLLGLHLGPAAATGWFWWTLTALVWLAMLSTIQSGLSYLVAAAKQLQE